MESKEHPNLKKLDAENEIEQKFTFRKFRKRFYDEYYEKRREDQVIVQPKKYRIAFIMLWILGKILLLTILFALAYYPERYNFFQETISGMGGKSTYDNVYLVNTVSRWIFSIGLYICAAICIALAIYILSCIKNCREWCGICRFCILVIMAVSAFLLAFPRDGDYPSLHYAGAIGFIVGFDLLMLFIQFFQTLKMKRKLNKMSDIREQDGKNLKRIMNLRIGWIIVLFVLAIFYLISVIHHKCMNLDQFEIVHIITQKIILVSVFVYLHRIKAQDMDCYLYEPHPAE